MPKSDIEVPFLKAAEADLVIDAIYRGGRQGNAGDDPLAKLLAVSNQGGFRYRGTLAKLDFVVLITSLSDPDWPDAIDRETGSFTYFGDNKKPGRELHDTPRHGNRLLRDIFERLHVGHTARQRVPPIFVFANTGEWRDVRFLGLAVPGSGNEYSSEDLVAIWRLSGGLRFQNYRARFTILDIPKIQRGWLEDLVAGEIESANAPTVWKHWIKTGQRIALKSVRSVEHRTKGEQLPTAPDAIQMITEMWRFFIDRPHDFEKCAAAIAQLMLPDIAAIDTTRPSRDGGRDAVGKLRIGRGPGAVLVEFALEAKCYSINNSVGVREMSRLISRLRHRQFGIIVTTSYVDLQAYKEIKEDGHPIVVISARDIVDLLKHSGYADVEDLRRWLSMSFSPGGKV